MINVTGQDADQVEVIPLGSGNEVGRSAIIVKYKGKTVMFDCGVHPAYQGVESLPFFDEVDHSTVNLLLVTHYHLDHCGAVPYYVHQTNFRGQIYMTHPTKALFRMVMTDFCRVSASSGALFTEQELNKTMSVIQTVDYHQEVTDSGIKFKAYNAGHVLGAAMFMVEIGGIKILYTGDYSREPDRHLMGAETPEITADVLIVESTYGIQVHEKREEREAKFLNYVSSIIRRGGRCLVPIFALGRAQELLLILEDFWEKNPELQHIPIYYASALAKKCMKIFQSYVNMMNDKIRDQFTACNPFKFKYIRNLNCLDEFEDTGPSVVLASPGMLQNGISRDLFEKWCTDNRCGVVLAGYSVEGTLAKTIATSRPAEITRLDGRSVPLNLSVDEVSFSAHSDYVQTRDFVASLDTRFIVLVHGDSGNMRKLRERLLQDLAPMNLKIFTPQNIDTVKISFSTENIVKVVGRLADEHPTHGKQIQGLLVSKDFTHTIVAPEDLGTHTSLQLGDLRNTVIIPLNDKYTMLELLQHLRKYFLSITSSHLILAGSESTDVELVERIGLDVDPDTKASYVVLHLTSEVLLQVEAPDGCTSKDKFVHEVNVVWKTTKYGDMVADMAVNAILHLYSPPEQTVPQEISNDVFRLRALQHMLSEYFANVTTDIAQFSFSFEYQNAPVLIQAPLMVSCDDLVVKAHVQKILQRLFLSIYPLPCCDEAFCIYE